MNDKPVLEAGYLAVQEYFDSISCSWDIKKRYEPAFAELKSYYASKSRSMISLEINDAYRKEIEAKASNGLITKKQSHFRIRLAHMLDDFCCGKPFQMKYSNGRRYKYRLNDTSAQWVEKFAKSLTVSENSVPAAKSIARDFFFFLQENGFTEIREISAALLIDFLKWEYPSHTKSMNNVVHQLRKILVFLETQGISVPKRELVAFKAAPSRRKIYPALESNDIDTLLRSPDRTSEMGKRDYAILLLASFTGLRAIDIANLQFENIDRSNLSITVAQHKTGQLNAVPINKDVLAAIDDYVGNARPDCPLPYVFLAMGKPYRKLHDMASVRNIMNRYIRSGNIEKAPWDGKTFHAFRRTIGKWLLESSEDTQMISQFLGHRDKEVLKRYLPLSADSMRECALDFSYAPLNAEVYR